MQLIHIRDSIIQAGGPMIVCLLNERNKKPTFVGLCSHLKVVSEAGIDCAGHRTAQSSPPPADFEKLVFRIITLNQLVEAARSDFANSLHGISFLTERSLTTFLD